MDNIKTFSNRTLRRILIYMGLFLILLNCAIYVELMGVYEKFILLPSFHDNTFEIYRLVLEIHEWLQATTMFFAPVSFGIILIFIILLWISIRSLFIKTISVKDEKKKETEKDKNESERLLNHNQRLFLHLLSLLQREGRLLDFFNEDLSVYDDAEIGAAVREIHDNCNKVIMKNLGLIAVMNQNEGDEIIVEEGFDPSAIKLTGNVAGNPPFKGILRHKGWQARKIDLPTLSKGQDSKIIAPAEIEII